MTDQHPLTDEICCQIKKLWHDNKDNWLMWQEPCPSTRRIMRGAADWQLEQVTKWLKSNTDEYVCEDSHTWEAFLDDFKKAMRPTQEDSD